MACKTLHIAAVLGLAIVVYANIKCKASSGTGCDDPSYDKCGTNKATTEDSACPAGECFVKKVAKKYTFGCKKGQTCGGDTYCCKTDKCNTKWQAGKVNRTGGTTTTTKKPNSASTSIWSTGVAVLLAACLAYLQ